MLWCELFAYREPAYFKYRYKVTCASLEYLTIGNTSPGRITNILRLLKNKKMKITTFNRFACFWPEGYHRGSLGKSHQNGYYLKRAMRKSCLPQDSNLQPLDYQSIALTGNPKAKRANPESSGPVIQRLQVRILWEDNFLAFRV